MRLSFFPLLDRYANDARSDLALYQQVLDQMVLADKLGFDSYWIGEHHGQTAPGQVLACLHPAVLLAAAAKLTQRIGLWDGLRVARWKTSPGAPARTAHPNTSALLPGAVPTSGRGERTDQCGGFFHSGCEGGVDLPCEEQSLMTADRSRCMLARNKTGRIVYALSFSLSQSVCLA